MPTLHMPEGVTIARFAPLWSRPFDVKSADFEVSRKTGVISGYMTLYDDLVTGQPYVDSYKDVVLPGCFKRTISRLEETMRFKNQDWLLPYLWQHDPKELIGGVKHLGEDSKGVIFENRLNLRVKRADEALALMEEGQLRGISYGYEPIQAIPQNGLRYLKEARLHELSSVTFPAHEWALVTDIKSHVWEYDSDGRVQNIPDEQKSVHFIDLSSLKKFQALPQRKGLDFASVWSNYKPDALLNQLYQMLDSFNYALFENIHDDTLLDKAGAVDIVCSQFASAVKDWLPVYAQADEEETHNTVLQDANGPTVLSPTDMMSQAAAHTLLALKQHLAEFLAVEQKQGRAVSQRNLDRLRAHAATMSITANDLQAFCDEHGATPDDNAKATASLIEEIKTRIPLLQLSHASNPSHDTQQSNTVQLTALTADMKSWLTR